MYDAKKDFERYKILVMYSQITRRHIFCTFAYRKQYVKIGKFAMAYVRSFPFFYFNPLCICEWKHW